MIFDPAGPCHKRIQSHHWVIVAGLFQERQQRQHMYLLWPDSHLHKSLCPSLSSQTFTPNVAVLMQGAQQGHGTQSSQSAVGYSMKCKNKQHAHRFSHTATNILQSVWRLRKAIHLILLPTRHQIKCAMWINVAHRCSFNPLVPHCADQRTPHPSSQCRVWGWGAQFDHRNLGQLHLRLLQDNEFRKTGKASWIYRLRQTF